MSKIITVKAKVRASSEDMHGYTTIVIQILDKVDQEALELLTPYMMITRVPNWEGRDLNIGEIGFIEISDNRAGDSYYNSKTEETCRYKYNMTQFIRFIEIPKDDNFKYTL